MKLWVAASFHHFDFLLHDEDDNIIIVGRTIYLLLLFLLLFLFLDAATWFPFLFLLMAPGRKEGIARGVLSSTDWLMADELSAFSVMSPYLYHSNRIFQCH